MLDSSTPISNYTNWTSDTELSLVVAMQSSSSVTGSPQVASPGVVSSPTTPTRKGRCANVGCNDKVAKLIGDCK